jgi:hypothetical protein
MLSQNPRGPLGQAPGSLRATRKTASPRKIKGQCRAQRPQRVRDRMASTPMLSTKKPEIWWLYSDHARSASVRGARRSSTGKSSSGGDESRGILGVKTFATSPRVARSATTSTAGGSEVSEAAAKSTTMPTPNSTSTKRRRRGAGTLPAPFSLLTSKKFRAPRARSPARSAILVATMRP